MSRGEIYGRSKKLSAKNLVDAFAQQAQFRSRTYFGFLNEFHFANIWQGLQFSNFALWKGRMHPKDETVFFLIISKIHCSSK